MKKYLHDNYHWIIAFVALTSFVISGGLINNISSLYLVPVSETLGVTRTSVSLTSSLRSVGILVTNMFFGIIYTRFGFKKLCIAGLAVGGLCYFGLASSHTVAAYGLFSILIGVFNTICGTGSLSKLVNEWFVKHRGLVFGVITAASGLGGSLFSGILSRIIEEKSWRSSHTFAGILMLIMGVVALLFIKNKPSDIGLKPYGEGYQESEKKNARIHPMGLPFSELKKTPSFYLIMLSCVLSAACAYVPFQILVAHLRDNGLSAEQAARIWSLMYFLMIFVKILDGFISDIIDTQKIVVVSIICCGLSCLLYADASTFKQALLPTVLYAIGIPLTSILQPLSVAGTLGMRSYDHTVGLALATVAAASLVVGPLMNRLYEKLGSYSLPLKLTLPISVLIALFYVFSCRMAKRDRERYEARTGENSI